MKNFRAISTLLTTFQMSYIYHQVIILVYKILTRNPICCNNCDDLLHCDDLASLKTSMMELLLQKW